MRRRAIVVMLTAALAAPACKGKGKGKGQEPAAAPADAAPRVPSATAPDPGFEARRDELLRRGDPARMKAAPVVGEPGVGVTAPPVNAADMIKVVSRDVMMVGKMKVDLAAGTAEIPAVAADPEGPIEYVAVSEGGKAYESLLVADVDAVELRLGLTLLGYEGTTPADDGTVPAATPADTVLARVRIAGKERPVAELLVDQRTDKSPPDVPWQVVGFRDVDRTSALASRELLTLVTRDRLAPLRTAADAGNPYRPDQGVYRNPRTLPAAGTAVTLVLHRRPDAPAPRVPSPGVTP